jgi:hypothetical protein
VKHHHQVTDNELAGTYKTQLASQLLPKATKRLTSELRIEDDLAWSVIFVVQVKRGGQDDRHEFTGLSSALRAYNQQLA